MAKRLVSYRHTLINASGTFLSRTIGVLKQNVINFLFGASGGDVFWQAFRLVNAFQRYIGEGAMTASFIPIFQKNLQDRENPEAQEKAFRFANNVLNLFFLINITITVAAVLLAPYFVPVITPGYTAEPEKLKQNILLTMIMMPYLIFISVYAVLMGILSSHKRFSASAIGPVFFNLALIALPFFLYKKWGVYSLGFSVIVGVLLQIVGQMIELSQIGFKYKFYLNFNDPDLKAFFKLFVPTAGNMIVVTLKNILTGTFLTFFAGGMLINMNTYTLIMAPVGVVGIAIGNVLMPLLAGFKAQKQTENFEKSLSEAFYLFLYLMVPAAVFFCIFPDIVVNVAYRDVMRLFTGNTGRYTVELLHLNYQALTIYGLALVPMGASILFEKIFYSIHDAKTPFWANIVTSAVSVILYILLCLPALFSFTGKTPPAFLPDFGMFGVIIADVSAAWLMIVYYLIRLSHNSGMKDLWKMLFGRVFAVIGLALLSAGIIYPLYYFVYRIGFSAIPSLLLAGGIFALFAGIYYLLTRAAKIAVQR